MPGLGCPDLYNGDNGHADVQDVARRTAEMRREQQQLQQAAEETARRNARDQKRTEFAEGYHTSVVTRAADGLIATHPMK